MAALDQETPARGTTRSFSSRSFGDVVNESRSFYKDSQDGEEGAGSEPQTPAFDRQSSTSSETMSLPDGVYVGETDIPEGETKVKRWDLPHGSGTKHFKSGAMYTGEWARGKRWGQGSFVYNGGRYEGEWVYDKRHGCGTEFYASGATYVGEYQEDKRHGKGRYTWPDGAAYDGEWNSGHPHGIGKKTNAQGEIIKAGVFFYEHADQDESSESESDDDNEPSV